MRPWPAIVLAAFALVLVTAAPAAAYNLDGHRWPSRTITYLNTTKYKAEVAAAAKAWNSSGARIRWKPVRRNAAVVIRLSRQTSALPGYAQWAGGRGTITLAQDLRFAEEIREGRTFAAKVIAHEMGHIMGIDHVKRGCAVMNTNFPKACPLPKEHWRYRCRFVEADDIRGVIKLYGGRMRKLPGPYCDMVPQLRAPTDLAVIPGTAGPTIRWRNPTGASLQTTVVRSADSCPPRPDDETTSHVGDVEPRPGAMSSVTDTSLTASGRWCYAVFATDTQNRKGRVATVVYDYTAPPAPVDPDEEYYPPSEADPYYGDGYL